MVLNFILMNVNLEFNIKYALHKTFGFFSNVFMFYGIPGFKVLQKQMVIIGYWFFVKNYGIFICNVLIRKRTTFFKNYFSYHLSAKKNKFNFICHKNVHENVKILRHETLILWKVLRKLLISLHDKFYQEINNRKVSLMQSYRNKEDHKLNTSANDEPWTKMVLIVTYFNTGPHSLIILITFSSKKVFVVNADILFIKDLLIIPSFWLIKPLFLPHAKTWRY